MRAGAVEEKVRVVPQPPPPREPMPEEGVCANCRTSKEEDAAYTEQSQLWGRRPCAALGLLPNLELRLLSVCFSHAPVGSA